MTDRSIDSRLCRVISPHDTMLDSGEDDYFQIGRAALDICAALLGGHTPKRIIDFPSGYGRVTRWFRAAWPGAELHAVEIDQRALTFVTEAFSARPILGDPYLKMNIPAGADLIFAGSLLTHLNAWQWDLFLSMCVTALSDNGVFVFTTHGRIAALLAQERPGFYGALIDANELCRTYRADGFAFQAYAPDYPTFGVSLSSPEWVMRRLQALPMAKVVTFAEGAWGQDVIALRRNPWPMVRQR
jgi:SAM-dependent methyltransferase